MSEDRRENNADYSPTWLDFVRDMHAMDKRVGDRINDTERRVNALEIVVGQQARTLEKIETDARETRLSLNRIENQLSGWRGSIAIIVTVATAFGAAVLFVLDKVWTQ